MSIPVTDNTELFQGGSGSESFPHNVIVKGSTWSLYKSGGRLYLKEYEGSFVYRFDFVVNKFSVSRALDLGGVFYADRFWLWYTDVNNNLTLLEIEPFSGVSPIVHVTKNIASSVVDVSVYVQEEKPIRVFTVYSY
jgi:hypothetical protein